MSLPLTIPSEALAWPSASPGIASSFNRFLVANIAFRRVHQLQVGARARVDRGNHKPTRVALLETLADTISWSAGEPVVAGAPRTD